MAVEQRTPAPRRRWRTAMALAAGAGLALGAGPATAAEEEAVATEEAPAGGLTLPPGLPATEAVPAPAVGQPRLVLADDGRVGVSVPVAYGRGDLPAGARLAGEVAVSVVVPRRGAALATYAAGPQALGLRSTGRLVDHQALWLGGEGEGAGEALVVALATDGSAALVEVTARVAVDADGDGAFEAARTAVHSTGVDELTAPERLELVGTTPDADPCSKYRVPGDCVNVRGTVWEATGFWHSNTQTVRCPSDHPYPGSDAWGYDTTTYNYTDGGVADGGGQSPDAPGSWLLTATDDNFSGHPIAYTPVIACTSQAPPSTPNPPLAP